MIAKPFPIALLTVALAGCSRSEPEAAAPANGLAVPVSPPAAPAPASRPAPAPAPSRAADVPTELPPPPDIAANEQMLDDASATGMTARAERDREEPLLNDADVP